MVRAYLNKSDHEEYLKQVKESNIKRRRRRNFLGVVALLLLGSSAFYLWDKNAQSTALNYPEYLGGSSSAPATPQTEAHKTVDFQTVPVISEEPTESNPVEKEEEVKQLAKEKDKKGKVFPDTSDQVLAEASQIKGVSRGEAPKEKEKNVDAIEETNAEVPPQSEELAETPAPQRTASRGMVKNPEIQTSTQKGPLFSAEKMPQFPGGYEALQAFVKNKLKMPKEAKANNIEGSVQVQFIVNAEGKIKNARIAKGLGYGCDEAALALLKKMPKWVPGEQDGEVVSVYYNLPVYFSK